MPRIEIADLPVDHTLDVDALERVRGGLNFASQAGLNLVKIDYSALAAGFTLPGDLVAVVGKKVK